MKFILAKEENDKRSRNTQAAMNKIKEHIARDGYYVTRAGKRITHLGTREGVSDAARDRSREVRRFLARSNDDNKRARSIIELMLEAGSSLGSIAGYLNANDFVTSRGNKFYPQSVSNLIGLYGL